MLSRLVGMTCGFAMKGAHGCLLLFLVMGYTSSGGNLQQSKASSLITQGFVISF